jgi:hypothetical protein
MDIRKLSRALSVCMSLGVLTCSVPLLPSPGWAELGSGVPSDSLLLMQRVTERGPGFFVVAVPPSLAVLRPVERVPRHKFGVVGPFPLTLKDLDALIYPSATPDERAAVLEGMTFFTTPHSAAEGAGPMANQPFCLGCHMNSAEAIHGAGLVGAPCPHGSTCVSLVSRAARSTPTNFKFTAGNATTGGRAADNLDASNDTGRTAAFTIFGDFSPSTNFFDPLDGSTLNPVTGLVSQPFGGFVQHTRPSIAQCVADRIPTTTEDHNLGAIDPATGLSPIGFRRSVGERAGPPYIGRGLMEAIPNADILSNEDPGDLKGHNSSLGNFAVSLGCTSDCVSGRHNEIPTNARFASGLGRFGLRANGPEILMFVIGGLQGELGFTSNIDLREINLPEIDDEAIRPACEAAKDAQEANAPEVFLSTPFSERNHIRLVSPPEFGDVLLRLLKSRDPSEPRSAESAEARVQRGATLFGIDLVAFANRMIPGRMPATGDDGLDLNAINQADRKLNCVGCHTPIQRTGQSPAGQSPTDPVARHLSFVWAPIFSDLLLHKGPAIDAERFATRPRDPLRVDRPYLKGLLKGEDDDDGRDDADGRLFATFDLPRNLADDVFSNFQASATGREFRTAPLMGIGRIGPPFLHDARVYLSRLTKESTPAGTVMTSSEFTNAPLVVRSLDDALRAAIELHDLPAPDDGNTPDIPGAGCPVPPPGSVSNVAYGTSPEDVICPPYDSSTSKSNRSEAREVIRRFRGLSPEDQQAVIEFLKEL